MNQYDIIFLGNMGKATIVPFNESSFFDRSCPVIYSSVAAACVGKRIAVITKVSRSEEEFLKPMRDAGIDLFVRPGELLQIRVVFPTANVDERQTFVLRDGTNLCIDNIPVFHPCLIHFCWMGGQASQSLDLLRALKARGFRLSVDMQGFVLQADEKGIVHHMDVPQKKEILRMADFVKLDAAEAQTLTGADTPEDQMDILEGWGSSETVLTSSKGVRVRSKGRTIFMKFTNRTNQGRMGRGDTCMGSYLAGRLDHTVEESLRFAATLTSIKLEYVDQFKGSAKDVFERMKAEEQPL